MVLASCLAITQAVSRTLALPILRGEFCFRGRCVLNSSRRVWSIAEGLAPRSPYLRPRSGSYSDEESTNREERNGRFERDGFAATRTRDPEALERAVDKLQAMNVRPSAARSRGRETTATCYTFCYSRGCNSCGRVAQVDRA